MSQTSHRAGVFLIILASLVPSTLPSSPPRTAFAPRPPVPLLPELLCMPRRQRHASLLGSRGAWLGGSARREAAIFPSYRSLLTAVCNSASKASFGGGVGGGQQGYAGGTRNVGRGGDEDDEPGARLVYREGGEEDLERLIDLSIEAFRENEGALDRIRMALLGDAEQREDIKTGLKTRIKSRSGTPYRIMVAQDPSDDRIVGMVELGVLPCPVPVTRRPPPDTPYLVNLAVLPEWRRLGVGARLVALCERVATDDWGYTEVFLHVKLSNKAAQMLYRKMGYVTELREPTWYRLKGGGQRLRPNPRLFMRKNIAWSQEVERGTSVWTEDGV